MRFLRKRPFSRSYPQMERLFTSLLENVILRNFQFRSSKDSLSKKLWNLLECSEEGTMLSTTTPRATEANNESLLTFFITFFYLYAEKVLLLGQIFEMEILMDLHILRSPESEKHIFSV